MCFEVTFAITENEFGTNYFSWWIPCRLFSWLLGSCFQVRLCTRIYNRSERYVKLWYHQTEWLTIAVHCLWSPQLASQPVELCLVSPLLLVLFFPPHSLLSSAWCPLLFLPPHSLLISAWCPLLFLPPHSLLSSVWCPLLFLPPHRLLSSAWCPPLVPSAPQSVELCLVSPLLLVLASATYIFNIQHVLLYMTISFQLLHLGVVHLLQDVALHRCPPLVSVKCHLLQVVPFFIAMSSCHLRFGCSLRLFLLLACQSVQPLVQLLSPFSSALSIYCRM